MAERSTRELLMDYAQILTTCGGPNSVPARGWKDRCAEKDELLQVAEVMDFLYREVVGTKEEPEMTGDDIIDYVNLLHTYGDPEHLRVQVFMQKHAHDQVFIERVVTLNRIFRLRQKLSTS